MGFVATPDSGHEAVALGVLALARLAHRGGLDADGKSGDGAGLLIQVPGRIVGDAYGVVALFDWDERSRNVVEEAVAEHGMRLVGWRQVPVDPDSLGQRARETMPAIWHGLIEDPGLDPVEWEHRLYRARRRAERTAEGEGVRMYIASCSSQTVVYKGLMAGTRLADFYLDLRDEACESKLAVFHQRYSTNTMQDWRLAQPFRMLAHNGEINTITGNRAWMRAREAELEPNLRGAIWPEGSDSASLDNALELLVQRGWEVSEALMSLVPDAWEGRGDLAAAVRDFYRYQSIRFEPWDGPAALAFSDGTIVGAALDRNGLRPLRWQRTKDGLVAAASEAGVVTMAPADVVERGRLGPPRRGRQGTCRGTPRLRAPGRPGADTRRAASRRPRAAGGSRGAARPPWLGLRGRQVRGRRHGRVGSGACVLDGGRHPDRRAGTHAAARLRLPAAAVRAGDQPRDRPAA